MPASQHQPVAAMLSGGLDSSSIACVAQSIRTKKATIEPRFETFSMVFDRLASCDERPFINEVVNRTGTKANFYVADQDLGVAAFAQVTRFIPACSIRRRGWSWVRCWEACAIAAFASCSMEPAATSSRAAAFAI